MNKLIQGLLLFLVTGIIGCAGSSPQTKMPGVSRIDGATTEIISKENPINGIRPYRNIVVGSFEASDEYQHYYPDALTQFRVALISDLKNNNLFDKVMDGHDGEAPENALQVSGKVLSMRIASTGARILGGAFAGSSNMNIYLKLTDVSTTETVHEKIIATCNNAFAAGWSGGASDKSMPIDMAKIISKYLCIILASSRNADPSASNSSFSAQRDYQIEQDKRVSASIQSNVADVKALQEKLQMLQRQNEMANQEMARLKEKQRSLGMTEMEKGSKAASAEFEPLSPVAQKEIEKKKALQAKLMGLQKENEKANCELAALREKQKILDAIIAEKKAEEVKRKTEMLKLKKEAEKAEKAAAERKKAEDLKRKKEAGAREKADPERQKTAQSEIRETIMAMQATLAKEAEKQKALEEELRLMRMEKEAQSKTLSRKSPKKFPSTLILKGNVPDTSVYIDKRTSAAQTNAFTYRGTIPFETQALSPGKYVIRLSKHGYEDVVEVIEIISGEPVEMHFRMKPVPPKENFDEKLQVPDWNREDADMGA